MLNAMHGSSSCFLFHFSSFYILSHFQSPELTLYLRGTMEAWWPITHKSQVLGVGLLFFSSPHVFILSFLFLAYLCQVLPHSPFFLSSSSPTSLPFLSFSFSASFVPAPSQAAERGCKDNSILPRADVSHLPPSLRRDSFHATTSEVVILHVEDLSNFC